MRILTTFAPLCFSSSLPEEVVAETTDDKATVEIYADGDLIFENTLYKFSGHIRFLDVRDIIEEYLIRESSWAVVQIAIVAEQTRLSTEEFFVIYSQFKITVDAETFLQSHFLTTRSSFLIHRRATQKLHFYGTHRQSEAQYFHCIFQPQDPGEPVRNATLYDPTQLLSSTSIGTLTVDVQTIQERLDNMMDEESGKLLSFTVHRAGRQLTFYVTDEEPDLRFSFYDAFGNLAYADLYAVTKRKPVIEQSEAHCRHDHILYDRSQYVKYEVETASLSRDEAFWFEQIFSSPIVFLRREGLQPQQIIITETDVETSDADNATNRMKFTFRLKNDLETLYVPEQTQIFQPQFQSPFQ